MKIGDTLYAIVGPDGKVLGDGAVLGLYMTPPDPEDLERAAKVHGCEATVAHVWLGTVGPPGANRTLPLELRSIAFGTEHLLPTGNPRFWAAPREAADEILRLRNEVERLRSAAATSDATTNLPPDWGRTTNGTPQSPGWWEYDDRDRLAERVRLERVSRDSLRVASAGYYAGVLAEHMPGEWRPVPPADVAPDVRIAPPAARSGR